MAKRNDAPETVSTTALARLFNVTTRRVQQLAAEGVIPPAVTRGRYVKDDAVRGYVTWLQERERRRDAPNVTRDLREEQLRKARIENDQVEAKLISREEVEAILTGAGAVLSRMFDSLAGRLTPQIAPLLRDGVRSAQVRGLIDDEQRRIRSDLADRLEELGNATALRRKRAAPKKATGGSVGRRRAAAS